MALNAFIAGCINFWLKRETSSPIYKWLNLHKSLSEKLHLVSLSQVYLLCSSFKPTTQIIHLNKNYYPMHKGEKDGISSFSLKRKRNREIIKCLFFQASFHRCLGSPSHLICVMSTRSFCERNLREITLFNCMLIWNQKKWEGRKKKKKPPLLKLCCPCFPVLLLLLFSSMGLEKCFIATASQAEFFSLIFCVFYHYSTWLRILFDHWDIAGITNLVSRQFLSLVTLLGI